MTHNLKLFKTLMLSLPAITLFSGEAFAAGKTTPKKTAASELDSSVDESMGRDSSQNARASQKANVDLLYSPASQFVLSYGAAASYNIQPNLAAGLTVLTGSRSISESTTDGGLTISSSAKLDGMAAYGYGRYFFGNSFNVTGGLGLRSATIKYEVDAPSIVTHVDGKIDIQSIVLPVFIGNRWTWDSGFTIGCDWIGIMIPISGSTKGSINGTLTNDSMKKLNQDLVDLGDSLAHTTSTTLFLTSIGWAF